MKESMDVVVADRKIDAEGAEAKSVVVVELFMSGDRRRRCRKTDTKEDGEVVEDRGGNVAWLIQNIPSLVRSHPTR
jgi:hypothetical protein